MGKRKLSDALIIRLPGLFGKNIKKNFIYDFIHVIPFMLKDVKFEELAAKDTELKKYYQLQDNGFYKVNVSDDEQGNPLRKDSEVWASQRLTLQTAGAYISSIIWPDYGRISRRR